MSILECYLLINVYLLTEPDSNKRRAKIRAAIETYLATERKGTNANLESTEVAVLD